MTQIRHIISFSFSDELIADIRYMHNTTEGEPIASRKIEAILRKAIPSRSKS